MICFILDLLSLCAMLIFLVINFQTMMFVSRITILSIKMSDAMSSVSVFVTTSIVTRQQVGPSLLTMNIRKAFHKFNVLSIEILSLFTVELSYFLWRKRQFIRSQTFTIKRIRCKFLQSFISLQSVVLYAFNFRIKFRSLYKLSNCNYSYFCTVFHFFLWFAIHECVRICQHVRFEVFISSLLNCDAI